MNDTDYFEQLLIAHAEHINAIALRHLDDAPTFHRLARSAWALGNGQCILDHLVQSRDLRTWRPK